jgi:hypothetical protein
MKSLVPSVLAALLWAGVARGQSTPTDETMAEGRASAALVEGDLETALLVADAGLVAHDSAWLHYDRGVALVRLGRLEEGLAELRVAERMFPGAHEKSLAIYRRALALGVAGRCPEAAKEVAAYQAIVKDARVAALAKCALPERQNVSGHE